MAADGGEGVTGCCYLLYESVTPNYAEVEYASFPLRPREEGDLVSVIPHAHFVFPQTGEQSVAIKEMFRRFVSVIYGMDRNTPFYTQHPEQDLYFVVDGGSNKNSNTIIPTGNSWVFALWALLYDLDPAFHYTGFADYSPDHFDIIGVSAPNKLEIKMPCGKLRIICETALTGTVYKTVTAIEPDMSANLGIYS